jgi:hypothetical protein
LAISLNQLPRDYELLVATGRTTWPGDAYLDALDAEWIPQAKLGDREWFYCDPIPNLLPFAFSGGHDLWCWRLDVPTGDREFEIIFAPRDCVEGDRWAPTFSTWAFRRALEEATTFWDPEPEARTHLAAWTSVLRELGHAELAETIAGINARSLHEGSRGKGSTFRSWQFLIEPDEYERLVSRFVGAEYWKAPIRWMAGDEAAAD